MMSNVRKRRKQQSPARSLQTNSVDGPNFSIEATEAAPTNVYNLNSLGIHEEQQENPEDVIVIQPEYVKDGFEENGIGYADTPPPLPPFESRGHTKRGRRWNHFRRSCLETISPIPTGMHMNQSCSGGGSILPEQNTDEDSPGYGALLGQEARKKKTITALRCRICGAFLKRSQWQRERNFYSVKSRDILQSLERVVGTSELVEKREGATYGCKTCFDKMMRLRSVEMHIAKLCYERETIVECIRKSFEAGQKLLSKHIWNGKIGTDYVDEDCNDNEKNKKEELSKTAERHSHSSTKQRMKAPPPSPLPAFQDAQKMVPNSNTASDLEKNPVAKETTSLMISPSPDLKNSVPAAAGEDSSPPPCLPLAGTSATQLMKMLLARHKEDQKAIGQQQQAGDEDGDDAIPGAGLTGHSEKGIKDGTSGEQLPGLSGGSFSGIANLSQAVQGRRGEAYGSDTQDYYSSTEESRGGQGEGLEESLTTPADRNNSSQSASPMSGKKSKCKKRITRKAMKLRGCFVDEMGQQQDASGIVQSLNNSSSPQLDDADSSNQSMEMAEDPSLEDVNSRENDSPSTVTEYKIARINIKDEVFVTESAEEALDVSVKMEPKDSENINSLEMPDEEGSLDSSKSGSPKSSTAKSKPPAVGTAAKAACPWSADDINWDKLAQRVKDAATTATTYKRLDVIKVPKVHVQQQVARGGDGGPGDALRKGYVKQLGLYVCEICGKRYPSKSGYRYHVKIHSGDRPFTCKYCQKSFVEAHILKQHERIHTGVKPYKCRWCDATFAQHSQIRVHERRHTKERPYKCDLCDKSFACNASLKAHKNSHQNKRPYACPVCGKSYLWPNHLRSHMKYHQEPHYACSYCDKKFISPSELKNHERSHTGERPYICDLCGKGFTQSCHLGAHKRYTHTNEQQKESLRCMYCDKKCRNYQGTKNHERVCKEKTPQAPGDSSPASLGEEESPLEGEEAGFYDSLVQVKDEPSSGEDGLESNE